MAEWKQYPLAPMYEVSTDGQVRRIKDGKILRQYQQRNGYLYVWLNRGYGNYSCPVHRMVAETFIPYDGLVFDRVDHINTHREDNRVENLRWTDALGNANNPITKKNMINAQMKRLSAKIKSATESWKGVDVDEFMDEIRGRK